MTDTFPSDVPDPTFKSGGNSVEARVLESQFGDGYVQRAADGYNNVGDTWDPVWENLTNAEKTTLDTFFRSQAGWKAFFWTKPGCTLPSILMSSSMMGSLKVHVLPLSAVAMASEQLNTSL